MKKVIIFGIILIAGVKTIAQIYNPEKAAEYAKFWCDKRNNDRYSPHFDEEKWDGPYNDYNNNCANFVSQCLIAGGLDLRLGAYGVYNGTGEVDDKGCIKGAKELTMHLDKYQKTDKKIVHIDGYYIGDNIGDPLFLLNSMSTSTAWHTYMCSEVDGGVRLFSANTHDRCNTFPVKNIKSITASNPPILTIVMTASKTTVKKALIAEIRARHVNALQTKETL